MRSSPVRYYGAKTRAWSILQSYIPNDFSDTKKIFVDLFGGSFVVTLNVSPRRGIVNDLNRELVDFWTCVRGYPKVEEFDSTLVGEIPGWKDHVNELKEIYPLYDMFKIELKTCIVARDYLNTLLKAWEECEDPIRKKVINATYFYVRNRLSWSGTDSLTKATIPSGQKLRTEFDAWHRFFEGKDIRIWCEDFTEVLRRVNKSTRSSMFIYADPPYYEMGWGYKHDMTDDQHRQLRDLLVESPHDWVLSYDDHPFIRKLYEGYKIEEVQWFYSAGFGSCTNGKHELIITNKEVDADSINLRGSLKKR